MRTGSRRKNLQLPSSSAGLQPTAAAKPAASSSPASPTGTLPDTMMSIMITSSGDPSASRPSPVASRFRAVRLVVMVAIVTWLPSHRAETAIR